MTGDRALDRGGLRPRLLELDLLPVTLTMNKSGLFWISVSPQENKGTEKTDSRISSNDITFC